MLVAKFVHTIPHLDFEKSMRSTLEGPRSSGCQFKVAVWTAICHLYGEIQRCTGSESRYHYDGEYQGDPKLVVF
jgi:hypothetical protein